MKPIWTSTCGSSAVLPLVLVYPAHLSLAGRWAVFCVRELNQGVGGVSGSGIGVTITDALHYSGCKILPE